MTLTERKADFKIRLVTKGLSPMAIEKCRIALDQYNIKTKKAQLKLKRRIKHITTEDLKNYEN